MAVGVAYNAILCGNFFDLFCGIRPRTAVAKPIRFSTHSVAVLVRIRTGASYPYCPELHTCKIFTGVMTVVFWQIATTTNHGYLGLHSLRWPQREGRANPWWTSRKPECHTEITWSICFAVKVALITFYQKSTKSFDDITFHSLGV